MKRKKISIDAQFCEAQFSSELPIDKKKLDFISSFLQRKPLDRKGFKSFPNHSQTESLKCPFPDDQTSILVIVGTPGTCKKSLVELLCKELDYKINQFEWSDQVSFWKKKDGKISYQSEIEAFESFLNTWASIPTRSKGIFAKSTQKQQIFLVPEVPSLKTPEGRERIFNLFRLYTGYNACTFASKNSIPLHKCSNPYARKNPLIIIHSIYDSPSIYSSLSKSFPNELIVSNFLKVLEMRPITTKRIESIISSINRSMDRSISCLLSSDELQKIAERADGDLKQAIKQVTFYSVGNKSERKRKKIDVGETKDSRLDVFHATARILYGNRDKDGNINFNINDLMRSVHSSEDTLLNYIHHNMYPHFENDAIEDAAKSLEYFAIADEFSARTSRQYGIQEEIYPVYSFQIGTRGILFHNKSHPKSKYQQVRAPCTYIVQRNAEESVKEGRNLFGSLRNQRSPDLVDNTTLIEEIIPTQKLLSDIKPLTSAQIKYLQKRDYHRSFSYTPED